MEKNKKYLIISVIILLLGIFGSIFTSIFYFTSKSQPDPTYSEIPFQKGVSFTTWGASSYSSSDAYREVLAMKEIGIEYVCVNVWWVQDSITATEIKDGDWTDTDEHLIEFFNYIHGQGMKVLFKPMLDCQDGNWRSNIIASPEWIAAYEQFILDTAYIAKAGSVEILSIGCEMGNWQVHETEVRQLISKIRGEVKYSGLLTYSANHDSFWHINWWNAVDIIGISMYPSFTLDFDPTLQDLVRVWDGFYEEMDIFQRKWNRSVVFTEIGSQNRDGTNIMPNDNKFNLNQDAIENMYMYEALFQSKIWSASWFKGSYWWIWDLQDVDIVSENGFAPKLPVIQYVLANNYADTRQIELVDHQPLSVLILIVGLFATVAVVFFCNIYFDRKSGEIKERINLDRLTASSVLPGLFSIIAGLSAGVFFFWAFTYYNQTLFNVLYTGIVQNLLNNINTTAVLLFLLITVIILLATGTILCKLSEKHQKSIFPFVSTIPILAVICILFLEGIFQESIARDISLKSLFSMEIMIILASFMGSFFVIGFPRCIFDKKWCDEVKRTHGSTDLFKIVGGIIAIIALVIITLSGLMLINPRIPSMVIGIILLALALLTLFYFKVYNKMRATDAWKKIYKDELSCEYDADIFGELNENPTIKERLLQSPSQLVGTSLILISSGYFLGILRFFNNHQVINFNLLLLPWFYVPIGLSLIIGMPVAVSLFGLFIYRNRKFFDSLKFERTSRVDLTANILNYMIPLEIAILFACMLLPQFELIIAIVIGGVPLILAFTVFYINEMRVDDSVCPSSRMTRMAFYFVLGLTIAFSANGIMVGLVYVLTFFDIVSGQIVIRTQFDTAFNYDVIGVIHFAQFFIAVVMILIGAILLWVVYPRLKRTFSNLHSEGKKKSSD